MSDWGIALLVIVLVAVVAVALGVLFRLFGIYHLAWCLGSDEEKAGLTQHEKVHGFMVGSDSSEFTLDTGNKYAQYDTLISNPNRNNSPTQGTEQQQQQGQDESNRSSPVSVGTSSIASDMDLGHGIRRAESCDSVASDSSVLDMQPDMPKIGQLEFALEYDKEVSELIVSIFQCRDLTPNPYSGTLDTFIKGILMPGGDDKFQTKTVKNTTDPVFKERFLFTVEPDHLLGKSLQLQVFSVDKYARQKVIGEADVRIGDVDLNFPIKMWFNLRDIDEKPTEYGDILFSLSYLPTAERLTVVIVKARSLKWKDGKDSGDPFVKVYLMQNGKKISKKKTTVKRGEKNPIFNEAMIFSVPSTALPTVQLRITVAEYQSENRTPSLGHVIVGAHTSGTESTHWNQMMTSLRKPVAMWHFLRK
ncbi:synaptotagmin-12-like isoform X2 [Physella acuta]|uniref:synaptotagmin-12-like isoform X2 n=1 Tax=Physella acuta TaxID=109671 RepID=UPI0027DB4A52|nr:synaptotagmin-12-like isoform X2 [Physella acuta]